MKILHAKNWFEVVKHDKSYSVFSYRLIPVHHTTHALGLRPVTRRWATWFDSRKVLKLSAAPRPISTDARCFYIAACSMFSLEFRQWRSRADRVLSFNCSHEHQTSTVWEHLESGPWNSAVRASMAHGQGLHLLYILRVGANVTERAWPSCFLELSKIL